MGNVTKFRFEQSAGQEGKKIFKLFVYDNVTAYGDFNWETWGYDDAETSANYFRDKLEEIPEDAVIELHVNSYGGDVKEGVAIYNLLKRHGAEKVCYVDGFAYSVASVICLACDKVIMGLGTSMLIHNMAMCVCGNAETLRKCADDLDVLMESNRKIYMSRAKNLTESELERMMDEETYLTPEQCLEYGFCDEIGGCQADQGEMIQKAAAQIRQLRQQISSMRSFREEMGKLALTAAIPAPPKEPGAGKGGRKGNAQKALKMMGAFLNAIEKGGKRT